MFDLSMLKEAAKRGAGKMVPPQGPPPKGKTEISVEVEAEPTGDVAAKLEACAKKYGVSPEQLLADFEEFEAQKYGGGEPADAAQEPPAEA